MESIQKPLILEVRTVTGFGGGPDKTILNSPRYLTNLGYETLVVFLHPPNDHGLQTLLRRSESLGVETISLPDRGPLDRKSFQHLVHICRTKKPCIWHSHDDKSNVLGLFVRKFYPSMKLVSTAHGWWADMGVNPWKQRFYVHCSKLALRRYDHCFAVSHDLEALLAQWGIPDAKKSLIENAIESEVFLRKISRKEAKIQLGIPTESILFGGLGRLAKEKNFASLVRAVVRLRPSVPNIHLVIGGEGAERGELESLITQNDAQDYVTLIGYAEDPRLMLQALDVFVLNSFTEGLPNVVLEAMAMETPVISTRVAAVPKMIEDRVQGLLVDIGEQSQLESAIKEIALSDDLGLRFGKAGRSRVIERFDFRDRMRKLAHAYDSILERP